MLANDGWDEAKRLEVLLWEERRVSKRLEVRLAGTEEARAVVVEQVAAFRSEG